MSHATGIGNHEAPAASSDAADEEHFVETIELFLADARRRVGVLCQQAQWLIDGDADRAGPMSRLRTGFHALAGQFAVLKCAGAARLCTAAEHAISRDAVAPQLLLDSAGAIGGYLDELVEDLAAEIRGSGELLAQLRGDGASTIELATGGEFAASRDEFLAGVAEQLALLRGHLVAFRNRGGAERLAAGHVAARGIAGVAGLIELTPVAEIARNIASVLAMVGDDGDALGGDSVERLLAGVDLQQQMVAGFEGAPSPTSADCTTVTDDLTDLLATFAAPTGSAESSVVVQFLTVTVAGQLLGLEAGRIGEVVAPAEVAEGIGLVDLRSVLGLPAAEADAGSSVVLVGQTGLLVDEVCAVIAIQHDQFEEEEGGGPVAGRASLDDGELLVLDLDAVTAVPAR